jgi:hypothetical protein
MSKCRLGRRPEMIFGDLKVDEAKTPDLALKITQGQPYE